MVGTASGRVAALMAGQWGLVSAAQASAAGVARSTILRRERSGSLERLRSGIYRSAGVPPHRLDEVRAAWLASNPRLPGWERLADPDVVVGGAAAAWVHQIGDLYPSPFLLYTNRRRQTSHDDVRYRVLRLPAEDVAVVDGLPVTTVERTLADLLEHADLSLVADALGDVEQAGVDLDEGALVTHLGMHARRYGFGSGAELYAQLRTLTAVDAARLAAVVQRTDLVERINAAVAEQLQDILAPLRAGVAAQLHEAFAPVHAVLGAQQQRLAEQVSRAVAPLGAADSRARLWDSVRVALPEGAVPQIRLPEETQAVLRDLAQIHLRAAPAEQGLDVRADAERTVGGEG